MPTHQFFNNLYLDVKNGKGKQEIIVNFLFTLATVVIQMTEQSQIREIALSGGVFQNTVLVDMLKDLAGEKYKLYFNRNLSPNDENISFGQLMYHLHIKNEP